MGRRKPGLDVRSRAGSAWGGRAYLIVARLTFLVRVCLLWFPALGSDCLCMPNYCVFL